MLLPQSIITFENREIRGHSLRTSKVSTSSAYGLCSLYGDAIPGRVLADRLASYVHLFNLYWYTRCVRCRASSS